jgi:hypothetical protein
MSGGLREAVGRKASFGQTLRAVAWSFFGIRRSAGLERDASQLNPVHLILAGLAAAALFVVGLVVLIRFIVASGVAA